MGAMLRGTRKGITIVSTIVIGMIRRGTTALSTTYIAATERALALIECKSQSSVDFTRD
jgi:hypothetical protein